MIFVDVLFFDHIQKLERYDYNINHDANNFPRYVLNISSSDNLNITY